MKTNSITQQTVAAFILAHNFAEVVNSGLMEAVLHTSTCRSIPKSGGSQIKFCEDIKSPGTPSCKRTICHKDGSITGVYEDKEGDIYARFTPFGWLTSEQHYGELKEAQQPTLQAGSEITAPDAAEEPMQPFTEDEVYNNQFLQSEFVVEKKRWAMDNFSKDHTEIRLKGEIHRPTRQQAEQMTKRTLCLYIASSALRLRDIKGAISNAMCWYDHHTKEDILDTFFPVTSQQASL